MLTCRLSSRDCDSTEITPGSNIVCILVLSGSKLGILVVSGAKLKYDLHFSFVGV